MPKCDRQTGVLIIKQMDTQTDWHEVLSNDLGEQCFNYTYKNNFRTIGIAYHPKICLPYWLTFTNMNHTFLEYSISKKKFFFLKKEKIGVIVALGLCLPYWLIPIHVGWMDCMIQISMQKIASL